MSARRNERVLPALVPSFRSEIAKHTVRERISDKLASLIASGILQVGDELPGERELAALLSVSRETVRGAIQSLAAKGVVEVVQGLRTRVVRADIDSLKIGVTSPSAINSYDLDSVHHARLLVERAVVADAAARIDDDTLARLERSLVMQRSTMADPVHFLICDREFHVAVYSCAGNQLLAAFVVDLYTYMLDHRRAAMSYPGAIEKSYEDHLAIMQALRTRDSEATVAAFGRHIERIYTTTLSILNERDEKPRQS
ncbi:FadR/GntR family transcriptional regulator [Chelatococcus sp. GCM10030263]|uniref:FadR/GntR family transcriptional regulator n=1 Tax=Chelatococcus sp. GCM10030263 TaxID=3273387 RepID=UPI0036115002